MFDNLGWAELAVLAVVAMLVFGPERLPKVAADAGRLIRELRRMASGVTTDIKNEMGIDLDEIRRLDPRRFFDEDLDPAPAARAAAPAAASPLAPGDPAPFDPDAT
ncbi:MAG TPA: Sec-independent protein translocase protein TatB [Frankiaceae bacterium]|nr:Sec-independent protein translocase protein TatB [Frankiaceae bacterium]